MLEGMCDRAEKAARRGDPQAARQLAELLEQLRMPPFPEALRYLWYAFLRLRRRAASGFGPTPISLSTIKDYCSLYRVPFAPWEIDVIVDLDDAFLRASSDPSPED